MPGSAAVAIWCDVSFDVRDEFDDWHAHEHVPERRSIPGFLRASRWLAADGSVGNFMLYEAESETTVTSAAYLERLNNPTPWSRRMMPHHRNMVRSLCRVESRTGEGLGQVVLTLRFSPGERGEQTAAWLGPRLSGLALRKGVVSAQLLRNIPPPDAAPTTEQRIRGGDAMADRIVLVSGYDADAVASIASAELLPGTEVAAALYRLAYVQ